MEELITLNAFEIEEVTVHGDDDVLDIKVLPNRAHDALGHRGMAKDICALLGTPFTDPEEYYEGTPDESVTAPRIITEDPKACTRFMSVRIDGVRVEESPDWLKEKLASIGQKSINSIVDITNYVQYSINKPMHAYDASLVSGNMLSARFAQAGERLTTLDDKEIELDENTLVIADKDKPLGLAGIKGGKFSGISAGTASVILESANFNPTLIRKTSHKYGVRTDASKRFENEISDELVDEGLRMTVSLILKLNPEAKVGPIMDVWNRRPWKYMTSVSVDETNKRLGTSYGAGEVKNVFLRLGFVVEEKTTKEMILEKLEEAKAATYKNPSSMREDAPRDFSCSSFVSFLFSGVWQPSISIDKYVYGTPISKEDATWGDLVFSNTGEGKIRYESVGFLPGTKVESGIDHVGVYVGDGKVTHISKRTNAVATEEIGSSPSFVSGITFVRIADVDEKRLFVTVPHDRLDIRIKEDLIEEVARIKGLSSIPSILPPMKKKGMPHKRLFYENKIKNILHQNGFSEIMTYSFGDNGEVEIMKGAAMDKEKLRSSLAPGVLAAFQKNTLNAPLLNIQTVKMYEFGNVFTRTNERRHLAVTCDDGRKKTSFTEEVDLVLSQMKRELGVSSVEYETASVKPYVIEIDFDGLIEALPEPSSYEPLAYDPIEITYKPISPYPFIIRDVAVWTPEGTIWEDIHKLALQIDSPLVVRIDCFDTFEKEMGGVRKISYAFRFVLQAKDRTLTDEEANGIADKMYALLKDKGYEIR